MSLSAWEQRTLDSIKDGLTDSDPRLVALLATFTRLASGEEMPAREKIRVGIRRAARCSRRKRRHPRRDWGARRARQVYRRMGYQRIGLLVWLMMAVTLISVALILSHSGGQSECSESWAGICTYSRSLNGSRQAAHETVDNHAASLFRPRMFSQPAGAISTEPGNAARRNSCP